MTPPSVTTNTSPKPRRLWRWLLSAVLVAIVLAAGAFLAWAMTPLGPTASALAALESDAAVTVEAGEWLVFRPANAEPTTGFIFYPGGRVDYRSYAPQMRALAEQGYLAVIAPMPLSLAVLSPDKAASIMADFPQIERWALGGHSLGGAMAAAFVSSHPDAADGLVLWAAYPAGNTDLSGLDLTVASVYGTNDQVATPAEILDSQSRLPAATRWAAIEGGNHAQFGSYGPQPGDGQPDISAQEQTEQTAAATVEILSGLQ